jgi:hypothetical protein
MLNREVGFALNNGHGQPSLSGPRSADIVAKVSKGSAANFPPNNETSNNRRSIGLQTRYQNRLCVLRLATWSPPSLFNRCTYGSENLSPTSQKDFCNNICQKRKPPPALMKEAAN